MPFISTVPAGFVAIEADVPPVLDVEGTSLLNSAFGNTQEFDNIRGDDDDQIATVGEELTVTVGDSTITGEYLGPVTFSNLPAQVGVPGVANIELEISPIEGYLIQSSGQTYFISDINPNDPNLLVNASLTIAGIPINVDVPISNVVGGISGAIRDAADDASVLEAITLNTAAGTLDLAGGLVNGAVDAIVIGVAPGDGLPLDVAPVCFTRGTLIETAKGCVAIETLSIGDMVKTKDNGYQAIRWIGARKISGRELKVSPNLYAIRISAGTLGNNTPTADLIVSPQHRVLVRSNIAQKMFGTIEILVAAKQLLQIDGIDIASDMGNIEYFHMLFDQHEVVISNGAETESLYTGQEALRSVGAGARAEIFALFPELQDDAYKAEPARVLATGRMARRLAVRHIQNRKALVQ